MSLRVVVGALTGAGMPRLTVTSGKLLQAVEAVNVLAVQMTVPSAVVFVGVVSHVGSPTPAVPAVVHSK